MPANFTIFPKQGLVHVYYTGPVSTRDSTVVYDRYLQHPDFKPNQNRLIDLRLMTSFSPDPVAALKLHARQIEEVVILDQPIMMVYLAASEPARALCQVRLNAWHPVETAIACLADTEQAALEILGLPVTTIDGLYAGT